MTQAAKKHWRIVLVVLLVVIGVLAIVFRPDVNPIEAPATEQVADSARESLLATETAVVAPELEYAAVSITYPIPEYDTARSHVESYVESLENNFLESVKDMYSSFQETFPNTEVKPELLAAYETVVSETTVSYIFEVYEYTLGAHGMTGYVVFMYDNSGNKIDLKNVLVNEDALIPFSEKVESKTREHFAASGEYEEMSSSLWIEDGTLSEWVNYQVVYLDEQGITVIFTPYQIGPYAIGATRITIPYSELEDIIKQEYLS